MTLLKVYNKNGNCLQHDAGGYGISHFLKQFPQEKFHGPEFRQYSPRVNISEEEVTFLIELEVPGIDKNLIKMNLVKDLLTISHEGEELKHGQEYTYREFANQKFERTFRLPESVEKEKITAVCSNGILRVSLPKKENAIDKGPKSIEIS